MPPRPLPMPKTLQSIELSTHDENTGTLYPNSVSRLVYLILWIFYHCLSREIEYCAKTFLMVGRECKLKSWFIRATSLKCQLRKVKGAISPVAFTRPSTRDQYIYCGFNDLINNHCRFYLVRRFWEHRPRLEDNGACERDRRTTTYRYDNSLCWMHRWRLFARTSNPS